MRIVIVCSTAFGGGAENSMQALHNEFGERGISSIFLALNKNLYGQQNPALGKNQFCFDRDWDSGLKSILDLRKKLNIFLKSQTPSHIIANCDLAELVLALTRTRGIRIFCVEHTSQPWIGRLLLGRVVRKILNLKGSKWITVSSKPTSNPLCEPNAIHIPNPIAAFPTSRENFKNSSTTRLIFAGRLSSEKQPEWCIEIAAETGLPLDVFGEGPLRRKLELLALNREANTVFHGYVSNFWTKVDLSNSILLSPSQYEGDGLVIAEAVILGLPVVLSDNADLRRFNLPESCYAKNPQEFVQKISQILAGNHSKFLMNPASKSTLIESRSIRNVGDLWISELKNT
jgi:glycosyltransferase involved in cell wall biosynthesis